MVKSTKKTYANIRKEEEMAMGAEVMKKETNNQAGFFGWNEWDDAAKN